MLVRDYRDLKRSDRCVADQRWESVRMLLADDGMGFSFHITTIEANSEHTFEYKHHVESVFCMSGTGSVEDLATGRRYEIRPGVMYALNQHDRHTLHARSELVLACCFNPPVTGNEIHREDGSYAPADEAA